MNWRFRNFLVVATIGAAPILSFVMWKKITAPNSLGEFAKRLAGASAINCGEVLACSNRGGANACTISAWKNRLPFYVWFWIPGIDSEIAVGYTLNSEGELYSIAYDSDPSGGMRIGSSYSKQRCQSLSVVDAGGRVEVACSDDPVPFDDKPICDARSKQPKQ